MGVLGRDCPQTPTLPHKLRIEKRRAELLRDRRVSEVIEKRRAVLATDRHIAAESEPHERVKERDIFRPMNQANRNQAALSHPPTGRTECLLTGKKQTGSAAANSKKQQSARLGWGSQFGLGLDNQEVTSPASWHATPTLPLGSKRCVLLLSMKNNAFTRPLLETT